MDLNQLFEEWLKQNNAIVQVAALAPKGGSVNLENFLPDGWRALVIIAKKEDQQDGRNQNLVR